MLLSVKFSVIYQQETIIMTMKLPIILSTMIAALAIPGTFASQADAAAPDATAPAEAAASEVAAPAKPAAKKKAKRHHHGKHHKHHRGSGHGHSPDKWDAPYDEVNKDGDSSGCSGSSSHDSGKKLPEETPGQKGPRVPAGE
jgi:ABC-type nickel/cobalt efflux system permease component RcnA